MLCDLCTALLEAVRIITACHLSLIRGAGLVYIDVGICFEVSCPVQMDSHIWDAEEDDPSLGPVSTTPLFPDALPPSPSPNQTHPQLTVLSTTAETTPNLMSIAEGSDRHFVQLQAEQRYNIATFVLYYHQRLIEYPSIAVPF